MSIKNVVMLYKGWMHRHGMWVFFFFFKHGMWVSDVPINKLDSLRLYLKLIDGRHNIRFPLFL